MGRRRPTVAVIRLNGMIGGAGAIRPGLTLERVEPMLDRAFRLPRVKAVALSINSPGGSPVQSSLICKRIRSLSDEKNVPVLAFCEDVAASGGYWLALAGDEIFADESSIVGSIGVVSAALGFHRLIERWGIDRRIHTAGANKVRLDPFSEERVEDVTWLSGLQEDIHAQFKAVVRRRRGARLKADDGVLFEGDVWLAEKAAELGLIDGIGDMRTVLQARFGDKVRLRTVIPPRRSLLSRLRFLGGERPEGLASEGLASKGLAEEALAVLEERALWSRYGL